MTLLAEILEHAKDAFPEECCGLILSGPGKRHRLVRARNVSESPRSSFDLDPEAWLAVSGDEEVAAVYHSHPNSTAEPSLADRTGCEESGVPWHIVGWPNQDHRVIEPSGFRAPYTRRPYVHAIHDCYSIIRDWYLWEKGIQLPDFKRPDQWWLKGGNLYLDNFGEAGFERVIDTMPEEGDVFLIQVASRVPNHGAIYLGNARILHHVEGRLSSIDMWGGVWTKHCVHHLRHSSKMGTTTWESK